MQIYVIAIFTSMLRPHISPIPSSTVMNLNNIIKPSFQHESSDSQHSVSLPDGVVHSHDYALISSSIVMKGQPHTSLRYLDASCNRESLITKEGNSPPSNDVHSLFNLQNASLSVVDVVLDMSSETTNHDVKCAVLDSSTIHVSFCEFFWTDLKSLFVLRSSTPSHQASSSLTLAWCTLKNAVHHLTAIVEDMRKDSTSGTLDMNIIGTRIANMKVVGADGVCVSQPNHRNDLCSFEGISTTVSEMRIMNVSSLPGEVKEASSLFSQRMVGSAIWGSNNHLSGSMLRDVNGGGSFLCSNSTFDWCHTTSSERPSILPTSPSTINHPSFPTTHSMSNEDEHVDDPNDPYTGKEYSGENRFNITNVEVTFTRCKFTNMKYKFSSSSAQLAGGSAICLSSSTSSKSTTVSLNSCQFSKCSVDSSSTVYGGCVYLHYMSTTTNTIKACSFDDWYPSTDSNANQYGGGIGTYRTTAPLVITESNFTLSEETTHKNNGGFISSYSPSNTGKSFTIANSRFIGDSTSTGHVIYFNSNTTYSTSSPTGFLSVTDSLIHNTNSKTEILHLAIPSPSGFTRTEITDTTIRFPYIDTPIHPHLFLDCRLKDCSINSGISQRLMLLFSGTSFTGKPTNTSRSSIHLEYTSHVVFHKCDFTDCSVASSQSLISTYSLPSLVVDTCSFTRCSGGQSIFNVRYAPSFFYFCTFTNVTGSRAFVMTTEMNYAYFFESCRFELEETRNMLDFDVYQTDVTCLNETTVTGCSSNRPMYFGTSLTNRKELLTVQFIPGEVSKNEMRVIIPPTDPEVPADEKSTEPEEDAEQPIQTFTSLSDALGNISTTPLLDTVITFSDGSFTEDELLEVSHIVEIVGAGSNISEIHSTQLTTNGLVSKSAGKLTIHSLRLVPSSATSFLNIKSLESLICVSGTSSLAVTNTLFLTITRTSSKPSPVEDVQCASCIEGKTSGEVQVLYCRFGACTTKGRAGAIDLENDVTSAVEIGYCYFDRNYAGEGVPHTVRGDDVVLKSFDDSKLTIDLLTIQSFPSLLSFLVNSKYLIVPPPARLWMTSDGIDDPVTWSYRYKRITDYIFDTFTLQQLLESRLRNNTHTALSTSFSYSETMTPFIFQNSSVSVSFSNYRNSIITVNQQNEVFVKIQNAYLKFDTVQFVFDKLTTPAFDCNDYSSIELRDFAIKLTTTTTLTTPFITSTGPYISVTKPYFDQLFTLDKTPFIQLNRTEKDAYLSYSSATPKFASPLTAPFIVCEGASVFYLSKLTLNMTLEHSASFAYAKDSTVKLSSNKIQLLKSTAQGAFLHLENGAVKISTDSQASDLIPVIPALTSIDPSFTYFDGTTQMPADSSNSSSGEQGGLLFCRNSTVNSSSWWTLSSCSAKQGGVIYLVDSRLEMNGGTFSKCKAQEGGFFYMLDSRLNMYSGTYSNCEAEKGGVAYLVSSTLYLDKLTFVSNSAKLGGVFWVDFGKDFTSTLTWRNSVFTGNSAHDVDENGVDCGKGGAIFVKGTTSSKTSIDLWYSHFEENTADFGNDVFLEETVLKGTNSSRLRNTFSGSYSRFPHLEIEKHNLGEHATCCSLPNLDNAELHRISNFLPFTTLNISNSSNATLTPACKWPDKFCKTLEYALQFLQTTYQNDSLLQRQCKQYDNQMTTDPIVLEKHDLIYASYSTSVTSPHALSLSATYEAKEGVVFTINDASRLTVERIKFSLTPLHQAMMVNSKDGQAAMVNCFVLSESGKTTSRSPIISNGSSLILNTVSFASTLTNSKATLSAPLISFAPEPSGENQVGSGSFKMTNSIFTNLTFEGKTMIEVETTGDVTFTTPTFSNIVSDQKGGKYLTLKGQSFKTQLKPYQWDYKLKTPTHVPSLWGEDISMDDSEKWKRGSLVYWLVSPSSEVVIGLDEDAVDHPNCGSSTFKCSTIDSAISSAEFHSMDTISFSVSTILSSSLSVNSSLTFNSFLNEKRTITFDESSSMILDTPLTTLSLTSLIFTVAATCSSPTLFVVEKGEMKFSSCLIGSSDSLSPLVVPATTTKLIEVKSDGTLILIDTLIQHIKFTHPTQGTALYIHADSTLSFTETTKLKEISSNGKGTHALIDISAGDDAGSLSDLSALLQTWEPSLTHSPRYSKDEINQFGVIFEDETVDELIYSWHPYDKKTMYLHSEGGIHSKCGLSSLPCSSLSTHLEKLGANQVIKVCSALDETVSITTARDLSIMSSDTSNMEVRVSETCSFTSKDFSLSFASISFVPLPTTSNQNTDTTARPGSLFIVESGSLSLTSCSVSSFELSSSPLITHTSGTLTLQSCSVSSITRSSGNGTVLSTEMETGKSLLLDEIEFSSMSSSKESPILALSFPPFDKTNPDPLFDYTLTNLHFNSMTGMESEPPCFISLVGHNLGSWIDVGDGRFKNSYNKDTAFSDLWSVDEEIELSATLLFYLLPSEGPVGVTDSGYDTAKCGSNSVWCWTIELSLTRLSAQNTKKIVVIDEVTLSSSIALPDELTFAGNPSALSMCVVSADGSFVSENIDFTTISKLTFSLPSTQTVEAVIVHSSTKLSLSNLELSSTSESSARFLKVTSGKAEMSEVEIRSSMTPNSILFWILGGTVTASQFRVESGIAQNGTIVRVEGGSLSLTGMTTTSSKPLEGRLISVNNANFNLSDIKLSKQSFNAPLFEFSSFKSSTIDRMNISECFQTNVIAIKDGDELTISNSEFSSIGSVTTNGEDGSDLCGWETSLIEIENTQTSFSHSNLLHIPQGAISISNSPLSLTGCIFSGNSPSNLEWPSRRRNIKCSNGTVSITGIGGGDGLSSPHLWIWTDECSVTKDDKNEHSPLFVPTLSNESSSTLDSTQQFFNVAIVGTTMIPCGLSLEVFEAAFKSKSNEGQPLRFEISSLAPSKWSETELSFVLPQSSLLTLDKKLDHRCRLVFGDGQKTESFSLIGKGKGNMSQAGVITSIVVPIVAAILVALLLIIILIVLCRRRKTKKNASEKESQELDTTDAVDVMKDDGDVQFSTIKPIMGSTGLVHSHSLLMVSNDKEQEQQSQVHDAIALVPFKHVEALMCSEDPKIVTMDPRNTLYHRIHVEKQPDLPKRMIGVRLVNGLTHLLKESPHTDVLTRFSPHWILMDMNHNIALRMDNNPNSLAPVPSQNKESSTKNGEDRRWNAPEQDTKEDGDAKQISIDTNKTVVFRLGLVLWELETELVPFGELDAVNASRQVKAGVMPLIHNWADESFADLVRECLSLAPDERPTLGDVKSRLETLNSNAPVAEQPQPNNGEAAASKLLSN
ncbi:hypothetical protein BLNAU_2978 [Blattamonas nauphoetae]|uniref:Protein kinase domain-containing protein n=1 Tax=Blattamonas nauphoetae TaxID=2049346 RepID=A0ABQ9YDU1_9EUKA|nr:hypothetical protein BLNAU_2978 [Blattamonas nauphoetae]